VSKKKERRPKVAGYPCRSYVRYPNLIFYRNAQRLFSLVQWTFSFDGVAINNHLPGKKKKKADK
jgi:hypothetical protein